MAKYEINKRNPNLHELSEIWWSNQITLSDVKWIAGHHLLTLVLTSQGIKKHQCWLLIIPERCDWLVEIVQHRCNIQNTDKSLCLSTIAHNESLICLNNLLL